jgi:hypothetical protein
MVQGEAFNMVRKKGYDLVKGILVGPLLYRWSEKSGKMHIGGLTCLQKMNDLCLLE